MDFGVFILVGQHSNKTLTERVKSKFIPAVLYGELDTPLVRCPKKAASRLKRPEQIL